MHKIDKKWVKEWDEDTIISKAVSMGMEYQAAIVNRSADDTQILQDNKQILVEAIFVKKDSKPSTKKKQERQLAFKNGLRDITKLLVTLEKLEIYSVDDLHNCLIAEEEE